MIHGVTVKQLKPIPDERGRLIEILRADDDIFIKFGQVYVTTVYPDVVKAWHYHKVQTDHFAVVQGMIRLGLYDSRDDSPTKGETAEFFMGEHKPILVQIPPLVYHGFKGVGHVEAVVINVPTEVYNYAEPDEFRVDPYENDIPFDWRLRHG
jgi:dTDP-4-dehydrorhamnose 3,5-epimerase